MTNDLLLSSDHGCISLLVLFDLSAAFVTINHNILLNRLENSVSISGSALAWFKSYLSDRHQFVAVNEEVSYRSQGQYGVPQKLTTDASLMGWGAVMSGRSTLGLWEGPHLMWHINCLEMLAVFKALKHFLPDRRGHHVLVRTDNTLVVSYILRSRYPVETG